MENERLTSHHGTYLRERGHLISSPVTGSMRPMLRPRRDSVLFLPAEERLRKLDVALFQRRDGTHVVHRVVKVLPQGYVFQGDWTLQREYVSEKQLLGVMKGFYRDERYIDRENPAYRLYSLLWLWLRMPLWILKRGRDKLCFIFKWLICWCRSRMSTKK